MTVYTKILTPSYRFGFKSQTAAISPADVALLESILPEIILLMMQDEAENEQD